MPNQKTSRPKTLVFHIGDHKTGSTSIQYAFAAGRVVLQNHSVYYPASGINSNMLPPHFEAYEGTGGPDARDKAIKVFRKLGQQLKSAKEDYCLISAEGFELVNPAVFREVLETCWATQTDDIRIIGYVRPHAARLLSDFAERTKIGGPRVMTGNLATSLQVLGNEGRLPYFPRFSAWRKQFGNRFQLRPMIRNQLVEGDVVHDFVHHAFDRDGFDLKGGTQANESLDLTDLMRLKVLQRHCQDKPPKMRHTLGWEFARVIATLPPPRIRTKLSLHKALAAEIHSSYLQDARAMDQAFFAGQPLLEGELNTALERAVDEPQSIMPEDHLPESEIRSLTILSEIISGMLENKGEKWPPFLQRKRIQAIKAKGRQDPA